jgi:hypothetical protein
VSPAAETPPDAARAIAALRALGAQRLDPVRFCRIEALARRSGGHQGDTRRLLDDQLAMLLAACGRHIEQAVHAQARAAATAPQRAPQRDTLADLLAHLNRHNADANPTAGRDPADAPAPAELKTVRYFRHTWSRLRVGQRMAQSLAGVPGNAGPLNTQRLLHQALTAMRDTSPDYVLRFMSHVETLLWLESASPASAPAKKEAPRAARAKKPAAVRPGVT